MKNKGIQKPIILVGGGTGGHIFPLVAIGEELSSLNIPFIFVGEEGGREQSIVKDYNWNFWPISAGKLRRYLTLFTLIANITDLYKVFRGFFQSMSLLIKTKSPAVFSKGGYVALPMIYAARVMGRKIYIHESDAVMGLTNRLSAKFATKVFTAFSPEVYPKSDSRFVKSGIPIRRNLYQAAKLKAPKKVRPLVLVVGGIQGASTLNKYIRTNLDALIEFTDIVHITGEKEFEDHRVTQAKLDAKGQKAYKPFAFLGRELAYYFQTADVVVSRSSATTIAEGALFSKAMYLIPLPTAAGNHQVVNAKILQKNKAALVYEEYQLSSDKFFETLKQLIINSEEQKKLGEALRNYFHNDSSVALITKELING